MIQNQLMTAVLDWERRLEIFENNNKFRKGIRYNAFPQTQENVNPTKEQSKKLISQPVTCQCLDAQCCG